MVKGTEAVEGVALVAIVVVGMVVAEGVVRVGFRVGRSLAQPMDLRVDVGCGASRVQRHAAAVLGLDAVVREVVQVERVEAVGVVVVRIISKQDWSRLILEHERRGKVPQLQATRLLPADGLLRLLSHRRGAALPQRHRRHTQQNDLEVKCVCKGRGFLL